MTNAQWPMTKEAPSINYQRSMLFLGFEYWELIGHCELGIGISLRTVMLLVALAYYLSPVTCYLPSSFENNIDTFVPFVIMRDSKLLCLCNR